MNDRYQLVWQVSGKKLLSKPLDLSKCNEIVLSSLAVNEIRTPNSKPISEHEKVMVKLFVNDRLEQSEWVARKELTASEVRVPTMFYDLPALNRGAMFIRNLPVSSSSEVIDVPSDNQQLVEGIRSGRRERTLFFPEIRSYRSSLCATDGA